MSKIKVKSFTGSEIVTEFAGNRLYKLAKTCKVQVVLEGEGVLKYTMLPGFLTDMRSGPGIVDSFIPQFTGNHLYNLSILCHDFAYTRGSDGEHFMSKDMADELLRQMALMSKQINKTQALLMYKAVRTPRGNKAYNAPNDKDYGGLGAGQAELMNFRWDVK